MEKARINIHMPIKSAASNHCSPRYNVIIMSRYKKNRQPKGRSMTQRCFCIFKKASISKLLLFFTLEKVGTSMGIIGDVMIDSSLFAFVTDVL